jgi:predicted component of type VI protein secretion system
MVNTKSGRQEPTVLQVFIFREGRFWGTECFAQKEIVLGRSPDIDLQLDDDVISRSHATVSITDEGVVLEDLGSSNGTYVNGEPVERCLVGSRDEVSVGSFTLKFKLLGRKKQEVSPRFETRIVEREELHDDTAIHPREELEAYQQEQAREAIQPEHKPGRREEIAAALREELGHPREVESQQTQRSIEAPQLDTGESQEARDEYAVVTQVEDAPEGLEQEPPAGAPDEYVQDESVPDHGTRWLTPEPDESPSLSLADELEPSAALAQPVSEPAPLPEMPAPEPARPIIVEPEPGLQPEPPLPRDAGVVEELEEDEEEEYQRDFVEPFSLLNNLIRENFAEPQVPTEANPVVEVIGYSSEKQVLSYDQVSRGRRHRIGPKKFVLVRHGDQNACRIMFGDDFSGGVITGGRTVSVDELKTSANQVSRKKGKNIYSYQLMKGDYANLIHEGGGSFVRFVLPPKLPPAPKTRKLDTTDLKVFGSSFLAHVIFIVLLGIFAKQVIADDDLDIDRFAKIDMADIMEKPEVEAEVPLDQLPEPEKVEDEKAEEKKKEEPKKEEKKKRPKRRRGKKKPGSGGGSGGGAGMMAALGNLSQKKPSRNIVAAVSNLDAVRVPGGRSRYKVSGLVTKLPTSSVVVSRGRGVGVKAGIDLLRGGKGRGGLAGLGPGALSGGRTGKRGVGGVVFKAPKRKMRVRGHLSRDAVARVVKKHLRQIQYCYEKNLLLSPKLAGKLIMEWTINMAGSVSVVKTKHNSMKSPAVAMCISAKIKGWKFPKPKGGVVVVSYPFIFNSIGF